MWKNGSDWLVSAMNLLKEDFEAEAEADSDDQFATFDALVILDIALVAVHESKCSICSEPQQEEG